VGCGRSAADAGEILAVSPRSHVALEVEDADEAGLAQRRLGAGGPAAALAVDDDLAVGVRTPPAGPPPDRGTRSGGSGASLGD